MRTASPDRHPATGVHSINHFGFSVPDLDEAQRFYTSFGLDVRRSGEQLNLYTFGHPHRWAHVHAGGRRKKLEYVSFGLHAQDLPVMQERIARRGIAIVPHRLSDGQGLWLRNPDGVALQLLVSPKVSPAEKSRPTPQAAVTPGKGAAPSRGQVGPVHPRRLSHVLFFSPDVLRMVSFCEEVLGMRLSDRSGDGVAFIHGIHGSDHHLIAFAKSTHAGLHHSSWDVGSIEEIGRGSEQMRKAGHASGWGVGRHVLGSNYFYYVKDPWGSYAEYSFDIDYVPPDLVWKSADHPAEDSLYVWGPAVPEEFFINHEQAQA